MGRWSHYLFGGDQDLDILSYVEDDIQKLSIEPDSPKVAKPDTDDEPEAEDPKITKVKLDTGIGKKLFKRYANIPKGENSNHSCFGEYMSIILAAYMMRVGANLDDEDRKYLRELVPKISSRYGYQWPLCDDGFREPGRVQFQQALSVYKNGEPHDWEDSCCWTCGRSKLDLGKNPAKCTCCSDAYYCNKECQKTDWPRHKRLGKRNPMMLNV